MKGGNLYSELYAYVKRLFAYVVSHTHLLPGWAAAAREKASVLSLTFNTRKLFSRAQALFSFWGRFLLPLSFPLNSQWVPLLPASSTRRQARPGREGSARVGLPHCAAIRSAGPASPGACGRARPVPSPASLRLGLRGHVRAEGWNSELWLLALLFCFFFFLNRWVCCALPGWVPRSVTEAGGRRKPPQGQTEGAEESLPGCWVRDPGPQLQVATI